LGVVGTKVGGVSLRDAVRAAGGELMVSVFPSSTEIAILAPASEVDGLADMLLTRVLHPLIDDAGYRDAKLRLAEQQVIAYSSADVVLRDGIFSHLFADGPFHVSTYGTPVDLRGLTLADAQGFTAQAYVPDNEIVVAVGGSLDEPAILARVGKAAPIPVSATPLPASAPGQVAAAPVPVGAADDAGVGIGWFGPPATDEHSSTAMDFLSDYLTRPDSGVVSRAVKAADPTATFGGQFITLRSVGVFYITVSGGKKDPAAMADVIHAAIKPLLDGPMSQRDFARAIEAFKTHTLRDAQTPQQLADNYGWYFAQGASAYAPSITSIELTGDYYRQVAALTPQAIYSAAHTYLGSTPLTATVAPRPQTPATTSYLP
jgi:predicted Zn-dependent peptidase